MKLGNRRGWVALLACAAIAACSAIAACGPAPTPLGNRSGPIPSDRPTPDVPHMAGGIWVMNEGRCVGDACGYAIKAAVAFVDPAGSGMVTDAVMADPGSCNGDVGFLCTVGGLYKPRFVILDLADGTRRVVETVCMLYPQDDPASPPARPPDCSAREPSEMYRPSPAPSPSG